jgi:hypothetical protein
VFCVGRPHPPPPPPPPTTGIAARAFGWLAS